ncbi:sugar-binding transcriptional regulator [Aeromicrobium sp. CTD01-1L150]|uniref:sugar-binding transcriptional regulator n=1 Tax=Aeromicrobium sp. CTD01-1L150 TaxID=3341830 RepID=UPI0035C0FED8
MKVNPTGPATGRTTSGTTASADDLRLALRAATLYHVEGLTQAEIARRLGVSRPTAGRLVARARQQGLVRIEVEVPPHLAEQVHADEERALEERFDLTEVIVVGDPVTGPPERSTSFSGLGRAAAALVARRIGAEDTLGFTWGPETVAVAQALTPGESTCSRVVQLDGSVTTADYQTGTEYVLGRCAEQLKATTMRLPAPLFADPSTVASLQTDSVISRTLQAGAEADVMMFGVGAVSRATTLFEGAFVDTAMLDELTAAGAVGEIAGRYFRQDGSVVDGELAERAVSVSLEAVRDCPAAVLVAGGESKHHAILGALRGGFSSLLVCDVDTARWLLDH